MSFKRKAVGESAKAPAPTPASGSAPKLSDVLHGMAHDLVSKWAEERKHQVWLGGPSREKVKEDIAGLLRQSYDLAKERYKDRGKG